jgi:hypothetical protein
MLVPLPWFVVLFATRKLSSYTTCPTRNLLQVSTLHMSRGGDEQSEISRRTAIYNAIALGLPLYTLWATDLLPSDKHSFSNASLVGDRRETTEQLDAPLVGDRRETTAQLVTSANKLRISVEDRRLSLDVSGKSSNELQEQLDQCNERIHAAQVEKDELERLRREVSLSTGTLEILMREPGVSDAEKQKIRSKLKELGRLEAKLKEKRDQLLYLLTDRLYKERTIIRAQLEQLDSKK